MNVVAVWVDEAGRVHGSFDGIPGDIPADRIAGTCSADAHLEDIVNDLRMTLHERAKNWIVDRSGMGVGVPSAAIDREPRHPLQGCGEAAIHAGVAGLC